MQFELVAIGFRKTSNGASATHKTYKFIMCAKYVFGLLKGFFVCLTWRGCGMVLPQFRLRWARVKSLIDKINDFLQRLYGPNMPVIWDSWTHLTWRKTPRVSCTSLKYLCSTLNTFGRVALIVHNSISTNKRPLIRISRQLYCQITRWPHQKWTQSFHWFDDASAQLMALPFEHIAR